MAIGLVLPFALLTPALAYYRTAIAVDGTVVKEAGNLTMGGKIGTYTVLLQVLNPPAGDLDLLLECCGEAQALAGEASYAINSNTGGPTDNVRSSYKGEGKCTEPGLGELLQQGNPKCTYLYSFKSKAWAKYTHTAVCVPEDVCAVNVAGATDGRALTYEVVLQILNPSAGNLVYAGKGGIGACQEGMNQVNTANLSYFNKEEEKTADLFGVKIPIGKKSTVELPGMKRMGPIQLLGKCEDRSDTGVLYVFDNKFWDDTYHSMNVTGYYKEQDLARQKKEIDELLNYGKSEKSEPEKSKPKLKAFDLAAALGDVAKGLKKKMEESKSKDSAEAQKAVINQAEKMETKKLASQAPEVPKAPPAPEAPKAHLSPSSSLYGYGPKDQVEGSRNCARHQHLKHQRLISVHLALYMAMAPRIRHQHLKHQRLISVHLALYMAMAPRIRHLKCQRRHQHLKHQRRRQHLKHQRRRQHLKHQRRHQHPRSQNQKLSNQKCQRHQRHHQHLHYQRHHQHPRRRRRPRRRARKQAAV